MFSQDFKDSATMFFKNLFDDNYFLIVFMSLIK